MNSKQAYYVTASTHSKHKKIYISTKDLETAFATERELLNYKTMEIYNIRHGKHRPKTKKGYIEIKSIEDIIE